MQLTKTSWDDSFHLLGLLATYNMMNQRQYKAGVALNNMAVSMVKAQRYHDAADTLKDALDLIEHGFVADVNQYVEKASRRLARPKKQGNLEQEDTYELRVLENDQSAETTNVAICDLPSSMRGNLIRIDDCVEECDGTEVVFAHAIILHNFATMCLWACWTGHEENRKAPNLRLFAFQFFTTAYAILCEQAMNTTDTTEATRLTILTILVLQNMMHVSFQLQEPMAGMQYYDKLCNQRSAYLELESLFPRGVMMDAYIAASAA